jgi:probable F420-dependent oxidoreductase
MQIGAVYPQTELGGDPEAVRRFGRAVEELGYDHLLAYDHVLGAVHADREPPLMGPYTEHDPFHDPLVMFAHLAAITEHIGFISGIIILPQRQTVLVARQAADVDLLSGGRLRLGVGIGWNPVEYEALDVEFRRRGARLEEQVELLRRLWSEPVVDFTGRFHRVDRAALVPRPSRPVPVWMGGFSEPALERAARIADGFVFSGRVPGDLADTWARMREQVAGHGRDADGFGGERVVLARNGPSEVADKVGAWRDAGGTHAAVLTMGLELGDAVDAHIEYLASVGAALALRPEAVDPGRHAGRAP